MTRSLVSSRDAALKLGTESSAARFEDVVFDGNWVFESGRAMSVVVRDGAVYDQIAFRNVFVDRDVEHLIEQVIGVRDPAAELGVIRNLSFDGITAPSFIKPASNWSWYAQFRPTRPAQGAVDIPVFAGADDTHAVDGLQLKKVVVNGTHLTGAEIARDVANMTVGPFVRGVTFE